MIASGVDVARDRSADVDLAGGGDVGGQVLAVRFRDVRPLAGAWRALALGALRLRLRANRTGKRRGKGTGVP